MLKREKCVCLCLVLLSLFPLFSHSQCLVPSPEGDTLTPVINRMMTPLPWGSENEDQRRTVYKSVNVGSKIYIGGSFQYIGPNTGTGVIMNEEGSQITTFKKWRINGPVYGSVADGSGGYYIVGLFSKVGDSVRNSIAHINSEGIPTSWYPAVNDYVTSIVLYSDTIIIGGKFTTVNGQNRNAFAMLNKNTGAVLPWTFANNALQPGTIIHAFKLVDTFLYVGGKYNIYNTVGSVFKVNVKTGGASNFPQIFQMEDVYAVDVNENKRKLYIGGHYGGTTPVANGFCIDLSTNAQLFKINVGMQNLPDYGTIYSLKAHGRNVYVGGFFNLGSINGNAFNQKGVVVFDTATGQIRNFLNNCNGLISSIHAKGNKIYLGGEFTSIAGIDRINFAIFDTTTLTASNTTLSVSDKIETISFSGTQMFIGGFFPSINCVARNGFASFDMNTGVINAWSPNIYANRLTDMEARNDTVFMSGNFGQAVTPTNLGGFVAVNGTTGTYYTNTVKLNETCYDMLIDGDNLYVSGRGGFSTYSPFLVKVNIPSLNKVNTWNPSVGFFIRSIQRRNGKIYGLGDLYDDNILRGFLTEINETTAATLRTIELTPNPIAPGDFGWFSAGALAGNKFFFTGYFKKLISTPRHFFAAFDVDSWQLSPIEVKVDGSHSLNELKFKDGNLYLGGSFYAINDKPHNLFAVIDTTVGAVFPDRMKFNDDSPNGFGLEDHPSYEYFNTFLFENNYLIAGGNFRNVNKGMFPSVAKLKLVPGISPTIPQGIAGPDVLNCPSQNNIYSVINPNPDYRYIWFTSGQDITIKNNGTDSIKLDVGPLAVPGVLKVIAITECGKSDTTYKTFTLNTLEPTTNASNLTLVRKTDTTATIRFTRGNGARRIVVIRTGNSVTDLPQDHQEYNADNNFGAGSNLGNNSYVVYKGDGDSVNVKLLSPATVYYVTVFEFNGVGGNTNYLTTGNPSLSFSTLARLPSVQASNIVITNVTQTSLMINCTPGNGTGRLVVMRLNTSPQISPVSATTYNASTAFGSGSNLGSGNFVVSVSTTPVTVTNLTPNTYYVITVFEFRGSGDSINYLTTGVPSFPVRTMVPEPTIQASNIVVSSITSSSCIINCTPGNGTYRLVVMRRSEPVSFVPQDSTDYPFQGSNAAFGIGTDLGDTTFALNASTPVNVSNLDPNRVYHIAIFEFNGFPSWSNSNYLTTSVPTASFTTGDNTPTVQATNLATVSVGMQSATLTCTPGNGSRRLFVIKAGSPTNATPVNGTTYNISSQYGIGTNIGDNTFTVASSQPASISGLAPGSIYYVKVFEYNGTGITTSYLLAGAPMLSFTTNGTFTPEPTQQATNISVNSITDVSATINCTPGNGQNRIVVIRQATFIDRIPIDRFEYPANTVFGSGGNLGDQTYTISNTTVPVTVTGLTPNTVYTAKIFEYNGTGPNLTNYMLDAAPSITFTTGGGGPPSEPTQQATNITASSILSNSAVINCTAGNGQSRLVVIRQGTSLSAAPTDGNSYNANPAYGTGSDIGTQTFVISNTTTPVTVTALSPETDYTVSVFEFNGSGALTNYLTTGNSTYTFRTLASEPTQQATAITVSSISSTSATINCTAGNGQKRLVVIKQGTSISATPADGTSYNANTIFGIGSDIGSQTFVVSNNTVPITVTGLSASTNYTVSVFEFNGSTTTANYLLTGAPTATFATTAAPPTEPSQQATNIIVSSISPTSAVINCTAGNGQNRLVVIRQATTLTSSPVDGTSYTSNTIFGNGSDIGGQTFVISNTTTPVTVTGLSPETDYTISVFEFNGSGSQINYLTTGNATATFRTIASEPTQQATAITVSAISPASATINCTAGNGQKRLVVIKQGTSISVTPADGTSYNANTVFGSGSDLGSQSFVISNTTTPVTVTGLAAETDYTVTVFEYNGSSAQVNYLISGNATSTFRTLATEPSQQATNITVSSIGPDTAVINCTAGNGQKRLVVIRQATSITSTPADGTSYTANTLFGSGSNIGTQTFVISNTTTPVIVRGLTAENDYTISIFEFNGTGAQTNYLTTGNSATTFRTLANEPTTAATNIIISNITSTGATINCTAGNGQSKLIVIKQGLAISANPADGSGYTANTVFGSGSNIGDQTFVVSNSSAPITVSGLQAQTDYTVKVFEYNGSNTTSNYLLNNAPSVSFRTETVTGLINLDLPETSLKAFPNPLTSETINLIFKTPKRGTLYVNICSITGAVLISKSFKITNNTTNLDVQLPKNLKGSLVLKCSFLGKEGSMVMLKL